ncbi:hypothetical protein BH23GEM3_BH23GEM3_18630 [soil metagenome]|nr:hypothetical protein [Gemmatimonadota bacterium]
MRFLSALARGRSLAQVRTLGFSPKSFEGTATTAETLALSGADGSLSAIGRRALLGGDEEKPSIFLEVVSGYSPYSLLLEAVLGGVGSAATPLDWVETWWATHGFGSSESNRAEAAPVFARMAEAAGLGTYVQGRKGYVSRIEWADDAGERVLGGGGKAREAPSIPDAPLSPDHAAEILPSDDSPEGLPEPVRIGSGPEAQVPPGLNTLRWELAPGREVVVQTPSSLSSAEKRRLLSLFELLLRE